MQRICQAVNRVRYGNSNRCLCATKDTAEVFRISNGKWNPCRRPNLVGTVNSYSIRHCAVSTLVSDTCHVAGVRRIYIRCTHLHCYTIKYNTPFDMLYDCRYEMIYDKSRSTVIWPNNWSAISGTAHFEMIDDHLFESVAVSISEENRNGDENTVEVAERQGIFRA